MAGPVGKWLAGRAPQAGQALGTDYEWELALDLLAEIGDAAVIPPKFWEALAAAARQMMLDRHARWADWRAAELRFDVIRVNLSLVDTHEGGRSTPIPGDGQLRPLWDIGLRDKSGRTSLAIAVLWVESAFTLAPGESAVVRLAPLTPRLWRHLRARDVITMHEGQPVVGLGSIVEMTPASHPAGGDATSAP